MKSKYSIVVALGILLSQSALFATNSDAEPVTNGSFDAQWVELMKLTTSEYRETINVPPGQGVDLRRSDEQRRQIKEKAEGIYRAFPNEPRRWDVILTMFKQGGRLYITEVKPWYDEATRLSNEAAIAGDIRTKKSALRSIGPSPR